MYKVAIVGIGPGAPEYATPAAIRVMEESDILIGGKRNLDTFKHLGKETYVFGSDTEALIRYIEQNKEEKKLCTIVSGDPGFYSLLDLLSARFGRESLEVTPGISSFQYLFSKLKKSWKDCRLLSLHGRNVELTKFLKEEKALFVLTDRINTPAKIADDLLSAGFSNIRMTVGESLSYPEERIISGKPFDIIGQGFSNLCVVVIEKNEMES